MVQPGGCITTVVVWNYLSIPCSNFPLLLNKTSRLVELPGWGQQLSLYLEQATHSLLAKNHGLRGSAYAHPSCFMLGCEPLQCVLKVSTRSPETPHHPQKSRDVNLRLPSRTHPRPWLHLDILSMVLGWSFIAWSWNEHNDADAPTVTVGKVGKCFQSWKICLNHRTHIRSNCWMSHCMTHFKSAVFCFSLIKHAATR